MEIISLRHQIPQAKYISHESMIRYSSSLSCLIRSIDERLTQEDKDLIIEFIDNSTWVLEVERHDKLKDPTYFVKIYMEGDEPIVDLQLPIDTGQITDRFVYEKTERTPEQYKFIASIIKR